MKRTPVLAAFVTALVASPASAQGPDLSRAEVETVHAAGAVHVISSPFAGNVGVSAGDDGVLIVDDQMPPLTEKVAAAIDRLGRGDVRYLLNTHWHRDHTGGNAVFGPEASIVAHHNVRRRLSTSQEIRGRTYEPMPDDALPVITFSDSVSIWFNGEEIRVLHAPRGHTDGDAIVWFTGSNVVHMGDHFFADMFPFVDLASGGTVDGYIANVERVLDVVPADAVVIPGHGAVSDVEGLRRFHGMLVATRDHVRERIAAGRTREEIHAEGLPEEWDSWAWEFIGEDDWIGVLHAELSGDDRAFEYRDHGHAHGG